MAQVRWYLNATLLDGWALVDQTAAAAATLANGWVVGTGSTFSSEFQSAGGDRASSTFVGNTVPDGTLDTTLKDAFRSQYAQNGSFAAGNWTFQFAVVGTVQSGAADGQIVFRILKADADGSNATELTSGQQATTIATNVAGTDVNISATVALGALTITNQYLFIQVAWKRTGAGGMTTTNIRLRTGSSSTVGTTGLTADYTPLVLAATITSTLVVREPGILPPPQAVTGVTLATTASLNVPTVTRVFPSQAVSLPKLRPSSRILYAETVLFQHSGFGTYIDNEYYPGVALTQSITGHDGLVVAIGLWLQREGIHTDSMYLELRQSTVNGTLLATSIEVPNSTVSTTAGWVVFRFPTPVLLTAATTYWIHWGMTRLAAEPTHPMNVYVDGTPDTYLAGQCCDVGGFPILDGTYDLTFRLYTGTSHTVLEGDLVAGEHIASTIVVSSRQPSVAVGAVTITVATLASTSVANVPDVALDIPDLQLVQVVTIPSTAVARRPDVSGGFEPEPPTTTTVVLRRMVPYVTRDVFRRRHTLRYRRSVIVVGTAPVEPTLQTIVAATIGGPVGDLVLEDSSGVLLEDGSALLLEGYVGAAQTFAPTVDQLVLTQNVTTVPITSGSIVRVPSVAVGAVTVSGATIAATSIARAPTTVAPGPVTVTGATRLSTAQIFVPSIATGPVGITGATRASTIVVNVPSVAVGSVAVTGATRASTIAVTAPSVALTTTGATIASTAGLFSPQMVTQTVTTLVRLTTALLFTATVGLAVTASTVVSASQGFVPSVAAGPVTVSGDTRLSTAQVFVPTVTPGPRTITGATIFSTENDYSPSVVGGLLRIFLPPIGVSSYTLLYDDFNRPDEDPLGGNWGHARQPGAARPLKIVGNQIRSTSGGASYWQTVQPVDFNVAVDIPTTPTTGTTTTTFSVLNDPASTSARNGFDLTVRSATAVIEWSLSRWVTGGQTSLIANSSTGTVAPCSFGMRRIGTTIEVWARLSGGVWTLVGSVTDANVSIPLYGTLFIGNNWFLDNFGTLPIAGTVTAQMFAPLVAAAGVTAVDATTLASAAILNAPTVLPQPVAVGGATIAATSLVRVPSIAVGPVAVTGAFIASTAQVFAATVTTGPVTVVGGTIASGVLLFTPTVLPGAVTVGGASRPTTIQTFTSSVTVGPVTIVGGTVSTTAVVFVPALTQVEAGAIGAATISIGAAINAPSVVGGLAIIGVPFIPATSAVQTPSLTVGPVTVLAATRLSTAQIFVPSIAVGSVTVAGATRTASSQVFVPSLALVITSATIGSGSSTFVPTLAPFVGIGAVTIPATSQVFAPTLTVQTVTVTGTTLPSTAQIFAPVLTAMTTGATIVSGSGTFPPTVLALSAVTAGHRAATSQTFAPTLAAGPVTVIGVHRAAASVVFAPSVAVGPVTILAPTRASASLTFVPAITTLAFVTTTPIGSTASLFTPTVLTFGAIGGPTTGSTVQLYGVTVTTGPVAVTGGTRPSTLQVFIPTIAVGVTSVTGGTVGTTALLFAPTTIARLDGTFIDSTAGLFPPTVKLTQFVTTAPILAGAAPFAPSVLAVWAVTGGTRLSTTQTFAPSITTGPIGVIGSTVPATVLLAAPAIGVGAVTVTVPHRASTLQVFAATVSYVVEGAHRTSAVALFPPALATGPVAVSIGAIVTTVQVFPPSLGTGITTATLVSASLPFAPTLAPHVTTPLWIIRTQLFPPSAIPLGEMILTFLPSGSVVFPPFMVGYAPPPEILDFTSNLVREVMGESSLDRVAELDAVLTTAVAGDVILTRVHETTARVLVDRVFAVTVER